MAKQTRDVRDKDGRKKTVPTDQTPVGTYDDRVKAQLTRALTPEYGLRDAQTRAAGDTPWNMAYRDEALAAGDRFGTRGIPSAQEAEPGYGPRAERTQKQEAILKGASAGKYRTGDGPDGEIKAVQ